MARAQFREIREKYPANMVGLRSLALWGVVLTSACVGSDKAGLETTPAAAVSPAQSTPVVETEQAGQPDADPFAVETSAEPIQIEWTLDLVSAARARALSDLEGVRATRWPDVIMAMSDGLPPSSPRVCSFQPIFPVM